MRQFPCKILTKRAQDRKRFFGMVRALRTGRGGTWFATYVGKRLSAPAEEACRSAAAVTTLKQERPGPWCGTMDDVAAVLAGRRHT